MPTLIAHESIGMRSCIRKPSRSDFSGSNGACSRLSQLLDRARRPSWRIWAENSPFDLKDTLKARGYRWNGDSNSSPRAWYIDVEDQAREAELAYLRGEIYKRGIELLEHKITAYNRFSDRL